MPVDKFPLSLQSDLVAEIDARNDEGNRSGTIAQMLERYLALLAHARRELRETLSDAETGLILDTLNGTALFDARSPMSIPLEIHDSIVLNRADEKWGIDGAALKAKVNAMSPAELYAIADMAGRWWKRVSDDESVEPADAFKPAKK